MHNAMHRWWKSDRNPRGGRHETPRRRFVERLTPQPRDVVATRYAALMRLSHKSTPTTTTGFERIYPRAEADGRKS
jgi:hypothetical protein